ncbi:MAG TPA: site-specific integrase [Bryobacteraceae bacterium]|jgi:integrase|nr:site-specific integrase [Bryobacteraceae bacterium]
MSLFRPKYTDPKTGERKLASVWWYKFYFAGQCIRESARTTSKTLAKQAEQKRRRELEEGFNGITDRREERIRTIKDLADSYLEGYKVRKKSVTFAKHALGHLTRHLGKQMAVEVTEKTVKDYQTARLKEKAAPKTINDEVGFLLRLLNEQGDDIRTKLRRQKALKLPTRSDVGKAYTSEEKGFLYDEAKKRRSKAIYPALVLTLNCGLRDKEFRELQWGRVYFREAYLAVGESKTDAGSGRTVPLNAVVLEVLKTYSAWYSDRFEDLKPEWFVFPTGKPRPTDPTKPRTSFKTVWRMIKSKAGVKGRWHDSRHTFITGLAESGEASDQTIMDIAGHVSKRMLKHYSHIRMEAKRRAVAALVPKAEEANGTAEDVEAAATATSKRLGKRMVKIADAG